MRQPDPIRPCPLPTSPHPLNRRRARPRTAALLLACAGVVTSLPVVAATAPDRSEAVFKGALQYTVQVRTRVSLPFSGDTKGSSFGSGFVVDAERGWIMTNAHVVSRSPSTVEVAFRDGEFVETRKVWVDPHMDLAIVAMPDNKLTRGIKVPELACTWDPPVGHPVGAFGHPWRLQFTGTRGIISGVTARYRTELMQTDAPINQGNSGGPLISLNDGRIVGINTASIRGAQNTNFAVAIKYACRILDLLQAGADPSPPDHGLVFFRDVDNRKELRVARAYQHPGTLALEPGDLILEVIGQAGRIENETQLIHALRGRLDNASLRVRRNGAEVVVNGAKRPAERVVERRGVYASGLLFGPMVLRDAPEIGARGFMVHHVEPGSLGEAQEVGRGDILEAVDGEKVETLEALTARLTAAQTERRRVRLAFKRLVGGDTTFAYLERAFVIRDLRPVSESAGGS